MIVLDTRAAHCSDVSCCLDAVLFAPGPRLSRLNERQVLEEAQVSPALRRTVVDLARCASHLARERAARCEVDTYVEPFGLLIERQSMLISEARCEAFKAKAPKRFDLLEGCDADLLP